MSTVARNRPAAIPDLSGLTVWLCMANYSQHARERILDHVSSNGTSAGCQEVDPGDEPEIERLVEEGFAPVPPASHEWGSPTDDGSLWRPEDDRWTIGPGGGWSEEEIEQARAWYSRNPSFQDWVESNGGVKSEDEGWPDF